MQTLLELSHPSKGVWKNSTWTEKPFPDLLLPTAYCDCDSTGRPRPGQVSHPHISLILPPFTAVLLVKGSFSDWRLDAGWDIRLCHFILTPNLQVLRNPLLWLRSSLFSSVLSQAERGNTVLASVRLFIFFTQGKKGRLGVGVKFSFTSFTCYESNMSLQPQREQHHL